MKKNLISVVILALVFANFVLTALLMFSVLPETKKANTLIEKVCSAIDLDLNSGAATGTSNISIDDQEIYKVSEGEDLTTNLAEGKDGKTHYAVLNVSLVLNKKSDNYKKYTQDFLSKMPSVQRHSKSAGHGQHNKHVHFLTVFQICFLSVLPQWESQV